MYFNDVGIDLIKDDDWIPFYHTFLNDSMAKSFIENRVQRNEIIEFEGRFGLNILNTDALVYEGEKESKLY